jgi:hypothetical protein
MSAGHIFMTNEDEAGEDTFEGYESSSDDDESGSSDSADTFELGLPSNQSSENSTATSFHDVKDIDEVTVTWSKLGQLLETSENTIGDGKNFDRSLVAIDNPLLYYSMVGTDPIHKLGEKEGSLIERTEPTERSDKD